jgi:SNF2 family DNA or RNA helicase
VFTIDYLDSKHLAVRFPYSPSLLSTIQKLPDRVFDKKNKFWKMPVIDLFILIKILKQDGYGANITKKAKAHYLEVIAQYEANSDLSKLADVDYAPRGMNIQMYRFQKVAANYLNKVENAILGLDMGLGKSPTSMASASDSIIDLGFKKNLIIVPASLKYGWAIELAKFSNYSYTVVAGDAKLRKKLYHNNSQFTIVNYDVIWRDWEMFKDVEWDLVLADEIQRIKNHKTAAHKTINKIVCKRKVGLTGTVLENGLMDLFNVMKFINKDIFGSNSMTFKMRYCELDGWGNITGYKNLDEISKKLSYVMLRRRKRDVLDDLPEKTVKDVYIDMSAAERKVYNEVKEGILEDIKSGKVRKIDILTRIIYLRQVCDCLNLVQDGDKIVSSKLDELIEILSELEDAKVVIFSEYERMTKILENNLLYKSVRLHGGVKNECKWEKEIEKAAKAESKDMPDTKRDLFIHEKKLGAVCQNCPYYKNDADCLTRKKIISKFNNDPSVKLFISTNAGKEGLNLQTASVIVNYDLSFNPATNEQRIARIDRIGQKSEKILVINLMCRNSIDEKVKGVSDDKQALFDLVVDGINSDTKPAISKDIDLDNIEDLL